ncbi:hypothetical protein [Arcicella lustrica]|uniref:Uncharacterized protein n=1 Tax=Arcicella lustrica TaxID=2984196 RepID=A0ABU5SHN5_9BACT|nr:hypothetical protein [Arcicella sp. DC25W]MEA5426808.1 hypothetical protein [Arcicella sp. DC25W]
MALIKKPKRPKANAPIQKCIEYAEKLEAYNQAVSKVKAEKEMKKSLLSGDTSALKKAKSLSKKK